MDNSKVYCIVVTYNGMKWIDRCLGSLRRSNIRLETVVIDNGSIDGTIQRLEQFYGEIKVVKNASNLGFGAANNIGIRIALADDAEFVFLLNQDAWIEPDTLTKLVSAARESPEFGIVSPIHLRGDARNLDRQFSMYISPPYSDFFNDLYCSSLAKIYPCGFINAAAWLLSRRCIEIVGLFEPLFFIYGEDSNYVQRLKFHKLLMGLVPAAKIVHDRAERKGSKNKIGSELEVSTFLYVKLMNIKGSLMSNIAQSFKVFVKFGFNARTIRNFALALVKIPSMRARVNMHRKHSYLLERPNGYSH
ncbi:MAG: glycosyltransferase family 2 protein [Chryseolinea sp.]